MATIEVTDEQLHRIYDIRAAYMASPNAVPPTDTDPVAHVDGGALEPLRDRDVIEAALNLLEVHWLRDEHGLREADGYRFTKIYSDVPADPLLRQRTATDFDLSEPFVYTGKVSERSQEQITWVVARQPESTDFASIPGYLTWLIPRYGRHTMAALVHDHLQRLLTTDPAAEPLRRGERTVTSTQADYVMRDAMRESGVPFAQRWIIWSGISVRTLVKMPFNLWYLLLAALLIGVYGIGIGVIGLGWALTAPIVRWTGGTTWAFEWWLIAGALASPLVLGLLWVPGRSDPLARWKTGVIASYALMLVAMPVALITVARGVYLVVELIGKLRRKRRIGAVTVEHNPIREARWPEERERRITALQNEDDRPNPPPAADDRGAPPS